MRSNRKTTFGASAVPLPWMAIVSASTSSTPPALLPAVVLATTSVLEATSPVSVCGSVPVSAVSSLPR